MRAAAAICKANFRAQGKSLACLGWDRLEEHFEAQSNLPPVHNTSTSDIEEGKITPEADTACHKNRSATWTSKQTPPLEPFFHELEELKQQMVNLEENLAITMKNCELLHKELKNKNTELTKVKDRMIQSH